MLEEIVNKNKETKNSNFEDFSLLIIIIVRGASSHERSSMTDKNCILYNHFNFCNLQINNTKNK